MSVVDDDCNAATYETLAERHSLFGQMKHSTLSERMNSPFSERMNSPFSERMNSPFSERMNSPFSERMNSPFSERMNSPFSERMNSPFSERRNSPFSERMNSRTKTALILPLHTSELIMKILKHSKSFGEILNKNNSNRSLRFLTLALYRLLKFIIDY